jgi:BirA family biotin operon repressor/biotin-[acetyl-CoA-carboxylase] ligase
MKLPQTAELGCQIIWRDSATSTNLELIQLAQQETLGDFTVMVTANQVAGRGRSGRVWEAPENTSLAISVLLRPAVKSSADLSKLGWLPLIAGLAMSRTVGSLLPADRADAVGVKWPNDVLVGEKKISGVLSELVNTNPADAAVVVGAGVNLSQTRGELPVETATSLALEGAQLPEELEERLDVVLSTYLRTLRLLYQDFNSAGLAAEPSGVRSAVVENCVSLKREVRVILPGGEEQVGEAVDIDGTGRIVVNISGENQAISAGDIVHLRHR